MITIEAYRASIGSLCPKAQRHAQLSEKGTNSPTIMPSKYIF